MLICDTKYAYEAPNTVSPSGFSYILYLSFFFDSKIENEFSVLEMIMMPCAMLHQKLLFIKIFQGEINTLSIVFLATTQLGVRGKIGPTIGSRSTTTVCDNASLSLPFPKNLYFY